LIENKILIGDVMNYAPICLFTYNRLAETKQTVEALKNNFLASDSDVIIFSDAAKNESSVEKVQCVRDYLNTITGFKSVKIIERNKNHGLAKSIITGVNAVIETHGRVIVIEDDLITSKNFLSYMNKALDFYKQKSKIWSISGFSFPMSYPEAYDYDVAFGVRASSWGWATWADRWEKVDWNVSDYSLFQADKKAQKAFSQGGSDICKMLKEQMAGKINSWAIRFCYAQFRNNALDVYPKISKVENIGFSGEATHTSGMDKRFMTVLDSSDSTDFSFSSELLIDPLLLKQFQKPFSILTRLKYKLLGRIKKQ